MTGPIIYKCFVCSNEDPCIHIKGWKHGDPAPTGCLYPPDPDDTAAPRPKWEEG